VVTLLLANGADVNAENNAGSTPLYLAVVEGHENVVELLHQHGAH
jgi:ankyrin repeat protein